MRKILFDKHDEDKRIIAKYYLDLMESYWKDGKSVITVTDDMISNQPKVTSQMDTSFDNCVKEILRKHGYNISERNVFLF